MAETKSLVKDYIYYKLHKNPDIWINYVLLQPSRINPESDSIIDHIPMQPTVLLKTIQSKAEYFEKDMMEAYMCGLFSVMPLTSRMSQSEDECLILLEKMDQVIEKLDQVIENKELYREENILKRRKNKKKKEKSIIYECMFCSRPRMRRGAFCNDCEPKGLFSDPFYVAEMEGDVPPYDPKLIWKPKDWTATQWKILNLQEEANKLERDMNDEKAREALDLELRLI